MARFEVIKAHDGLQVGDIRLLPASPVTDYMVEKGYWREIKPETSDKIETKPETSDKIETKPEASDKIETKLESKSGPKNKSKKGKK